MGSVEATSKINSRQWIVWSALAVMLLLATVSLFVSLSRALDREKGSQDFQWSPSRLFWEGKNPYSVYLGMIEKTRFELRAEDSPFQLSQHADYPITGYVMLLPYAVFAWPIAKVLWALSNMVFAVAFLLGVFRIARIEDRTTQLFLAAVFLMSTPFRNAVGNGQHGFFSLAFFVWAVIWSSKNQRVAGLLLGLSWLKYTVTFPLTLFFCVRHRFTTMIVAGLVHIVLLAVAGFWTGESPMRLMQDYLEVVGLFPVSGDLDIFGLLIRLGGDAKRWAPLAMVVLFALTSLAAFRSSARSDLWQLSFLAVASCIVIIHHQYDFIVLLLPLAYLCANGVRNMSSMFFLLSVITTWYLRKAAELGDRLLPDAAPVSMEELIYFLTASVFYSALLYYSLFPDSEAEEEGSCQVAKPGT